MLDVWEDVSVGGSVSVVSFADSGFEREELWRIWRSVRWVGDLVRGEMDLHGLDS